MIRIKKNNLDEEYNEKYKTPRINGFNIIESEVSFHTKKNYENWSGNNRFFCRGMIYSG